MVAAGLPGASWRGGWPCPWSHTYLKILTHRRLGGAVTGADPLQPRSQSRELAVIWHAGLNECCRSWYEAASLEAYTESCAVQLP